MAEAILSVPNTSDALKTFSETVHKDIQEALPHSSSASASASETGCAPKQDPGIKQATSSKEVLPASTKGNDKTREKVSQDSKGSARSEAKSPALSSFPEEEQHSEQLQTEAQTSSLQPPTPPLSSPAGASPSRPASVSEGEETSRAGPPDYPPLDGIAEGIRAALESNLRCIPCCVY